MISAHVEFDAPTHKMQLWLVTDGNKELRHEIEAHGQSIGDPGSPDPYGPDCKWPPGDFYLGEPETCATRNADGSATIHDDTPPDWDRAFGCFFTPGLDPNGILAAHDREGNGVHGGGSGASEPFAMQQGWFPTEGCARLQNEDNEKIFVPFVRYVRDQARQQGSNPDRAVRFTVAY